MTICSVCGGTDFASQKVLWRELIEQWELLPEEVAYIDRQQGTQCTRCGANLRIIALGRAVQAVFTTALPLRQAVAAGDLARWSLLDINGCEGLSATLQPLPGYVRADFPHIDMRAMPYPDASFDLVIHSDTLEHVPDPLRALVECRRVLKPGGRLCFTVPIIIGRLTRDRTGLPKSYHGDAQIGADDYLVRSEFGADAWSLVLRAGFDNLAITPVEHPAAHALTAWCGGPTTAIARA